jgi:type II secretory ATPase GspE/PulE/Tfp pilus assembly ATPase PilB-like protein
VIIGQRLIRKLTDQKEKYYLTKAELETLGKSINLDKVLDALRAEKIVEKSAKWEDVPFWRLKKDVDPDTGFSGRVAIHEVMRVSPAIKEVILKEGTSDEIQAVAEKEGMLTMYEDGIMQAVMGNTTIEEVVRATSE